MDLPIPSITSLASTVAALLGLPAPAASNTQPLAEVLADIPAASRVALLAPDALGRYPFGLWRQEVPFLSRLPDRVSLTPRSSLPSITPVNFTKCAI